MKKILTITFILTSLFNFSQELGDGETMKISDISLPSAQSFEMTKRGDVPVDESSGRVSLTVPIGNYVNKGITIPISLSYDGAGVKMSQTSNWTGTSWSLNAGGLITRIVKDLPDETNNTKIYNLVSNLGVNPSSELIYEYQNMFRNSQSYDSEYDNFSFSFLNFSGTFILKRETSGLVPLIINNKDDLKIELVGNFNEQDHYEFIITATDGTKYYFGGFMSATEPNSATGYAIEETEIIDNVISSRRNKRAKSAFYLTKIQNYLGDEVYFEYYNEIMYKNYIIDEQFIDQTFSTSKNEFNGEFCSPSIRLDDSNTIFRYVDNRIYNGKFLKSIHGESSTGHHVEFISHKKLKQDHTGNLMLLKYRILEEIRFYDKNVKLEYFPAVSDVLDNSTQYDRFFLTDVKFLNKTNESRNENFKLEYFNLSQLPLYVSLAQDHMGHYNGVNSNTTLLPKNGDKFFKRFIDLNSNYFAGFNLSFFSFDNRSTVLADREARFNYAVCGMLKKIHYPEKGFSEFEYEPVIKNEIKENKELSIFHNRNGNCKMNDELTLSNLYVGIDNNTYLGTFPNQKLQIQLNFGGLNMPNIHLDYHDFAYVKITDQTSNVITIKKVHLNAEHIYGTEAVDFDSPLINYNNSNDFSTSFTFNYDYDKSHSYKFELGFGDENYTNTNGYINSANSSYLSNISANLSFSFVAGLDLNDGYGIRIRRTKDYVNNSAQPITKRYYYKAYHQIGELFFDNSIETFNPFYHDMYIVDDSELLACNGGCGSPNSTKGIVFFYNYKTRLSSNEILRNLPSSSVPAIYKNVTISYGGDSFENGGIQKNYLLKSDSSQEIYKPINGALEHAYIGAPCVPAAHEDEVAEELVNQMKLFNSSSKSNLGALNGLLLSEIYFNGDGEKFKTIYNNYQFVTYDLVNSLNIIKLFTPKYFIEPCISNVYTGKYITRFYKPFLKNVITTEFFDKLDFNEFADTYYIKGDSHKDFDNDGIPNFMDEDYLITFEEYEANRKKIVTKTSYDYSLTDRVSMPNSVSSSTSEPNVFNIKKIYYPISNHINLLTGLTSEENSNYLALNTNYIINKPIQIENYIDSEKLSTNRIVYKNFGNKILPYKSLSSKGQGVLEFNEEITQYDSNWNPIEIKNKESFFTSYIWSSNRQVLAKAANVSHIDLLAAMSNSGISMNDVGITASIPPPTFYQYVPRAFVTFYKYNPISKKLINEIDANAKVKTYHYDNFYDLKFIKDNDGNIVKEFEQHFKPQN